MTPSQRLWVLEQTNQALAAKHVYARMAACEAALESGFGTSALARLGFNLFGMKQHVHPIYGTLNLPTKEFENGQWVPQVQKWVQYENEEECFADRMQTLMRLRDEYPEYQAALTATDSGIYIVQVSKRWSTDPGRAGKVLAIHAEVYPYPDSSGDVHLDVT